MSEDLKNQIQLVVDMANPACSKGYDHDKFVAGSRALKRNVIVSKQHAFSLSELVNKFKQFIEFANIPKTERRSDEWTMGYCDELLDDLNG